MKSFVAIALSCFLFALAPAAHASPGLDVNNDGIEEIPVIQKSGNSYSLSFNSLDPQDILPQFSFAGRTSFLVPGVWSEEGSVQVVQALYEGSVRGTWIHEGFESLTFGVNGMLFIAGQDFDGNGISDIATVSKNGNVEFALNPFSQAPDFLSGMKFPRKRVRRGALLALQQSDGGQELALVQKRNVGGIPRYFLSTLSLDGEQKTRRLLGFARPIEDAKSIQKPGGDDALLLVSDDPLLNSKRKSVSVLDSTGSIIFRQYYRKKKIQQVLVGDYDSSPGEEIVVVGKAGQGILLNPFTGFSAPVVVPAGRLLDAQGRFSLLAQTTKVDKEQPVSEKPATDKTDQPSADVPTGSGLKSVCKSVRKFFPGTLYKPEADASDNRFGKPVVLLQGSSKTGSSNLNVYASNGARVCNFTFKASSIQNVNGGAHHYFSGWSGGCGKRGSEIAALARRSSGSSDVYVQWKSGVCLGPVNPTGRFGSLY